MAPQPSAPSMAMPFDVQESRDETPSASPSSVSEASVPPIPDHLLGRLRGTIKSFNHGTGFGFVKCEETHKEYHRDVFLHKAQFVGLRVGQKVIFSIEMNEKGMPQARDVVKVTNGESKEEKKDSIPEALSSAISAAAAAECSGVEREPTGSLLLDFFNPSTTSSSSSNRSSLQELIERDEEEDAFPDDDDMPPTLVDELPSPPITPFTPPAISVEQTRAATGLPNVPQQSEIVPPTTESSASVDGTTRTGTASVPMVYTPNQFFFFVPPGGMPMFTTIPGTTLVYPATSNPKPFVLPGQP